uniref:CUB domain-containing protein n=1 Tax=Sparus aurata TaxID=8175 RepID=A0A671WSA1_SPAAU
FMLLLIIVSGRLCVCNAWGGPLPSVSQAIPSQPADETDLSVPKGYHIQLSLTHLDIEESSGCSQDSLTVLHDQEVLGKFCGQKNSTDYPDRESILSQSNKLSLIFRTSDSTPELQQHIGFSGVYKAIDVDECSKPDPGDGSGPLCSQACTSAHVCVSNVYSECMTLNVLNVCNLDSALLN